ncbi:MAG: SpaA isopeptide-forming pilin-related protein, partial [Peptostreptococcaceae bacterium]|nr:SpaA isopeptide-forming pilin-related protein [Peptostreptococcaceae bacterium]
AHPILNSSGKRVGEWIEVTGFKKNQDESYNLKTQAVSPRLHLNNSNGTKVEATAVLVSSNTKLNHSNAHTLLPFRVLYKDLLKREAMSDPIKNVNLHTDGHSKEDPTGLNVGFDYKEKAVIYRLSLNADSIAFSERDFFDPDTNEFKKYGKITYTDVLPDGWEFVPIKDSEMFIFFDGRANETSLRSISPDTTPDAPPVGFKAEFGKNVATFTFDNLTRSHAILLKARPTSEKITEYFTKDGTQTPVNRLRFKAEGYHQQLEMRRGVNITNNTIAKSYFSDNVPKEGILEWIVEYKPTELAHTGATLEDQLPVGIDIPTDSKGDPVSTIENNKAFFIQELELKADGTYSNGSEVPATLGDNVKYDKNTRTLTFKIPDGNKAYRFKYLTYVTGDPGSVTNKIKLLGTNETNNTGGSTFVIPAIDANVLLRRGGIVSITKVDGTNNQKLSGAVFTIFPQGGTTALRTGTTRADGTLLLRGLPEGTYTLREVSPPTGYSLDTTDHTVIVEKSGGVFAAKVNGTQSNLLTVKNYSTNSGQLKISNEVTGTDSDQTKDFIYTIDFPGGAVYPYSKSDGTSGVIRSGQTFKLKHGENIVFSNLPPGLKVNVTERPDDYTVNDPGAARSVTIETGKMATIHYVNTKNKPAPTTGGIKVTNAVQGTAADNMKDFNFTVTFSDGRSYPYTGEGGAISGTITSGGTIKLKHGQSFTINDLPKDLVVTIVEDPDDYTLVTPDNKQQSKTIVAGQIQQIDYVNEKNAVVPKTGEVTVTNKVEGNVADPNKPFTYTVTFSDGKTYPFTGTNGVTPGNITSGGTIELKDGQSFTITGIPEGVTVTIVEDPADYTLVSPGSPSQTVTIEAGVPKKIDYVNRKESSGGGGGNPGGGSPEVGHLRVTNQVSGSAADLNKDFKYTITFSGNQSFDYTKNGNPAGKIQSGDVFYLRNGENILVTDMPKDLVVTIVEDAVVADGYEVDPLNKEIVKTIIANETVLAPFKNTKELPVGDVQISNTVGGVGADLNKPFTYTVTFNGIQQYDYTKSDGTSGKISSGGTFTLTHGQTFTIKGMPADLDVTVTQNGEVSYTTTPGLSRADKIIADHMIYMPFVNTIAPAGGGNPGGGSPGSGNPGSGTPQSPVRPDPAKPETLVPPPTPLAPPSSSTPDPSPSSDGGFDSLVDSSTLEDYSTPKSQVDSDSKTKSNTKNTRISGAPKTSGVGNFNIMFKNFLIYGTMLLLLMALVDEYAFKKRY